MALEITANNFQDEVLNSEIPVLVDFWATWCGPCRMIAPIIDQLSQELEGKVKICKINVDDENSLAAKYNVMSIPTILLFKNGELKQKSIGMQSKTELQDIIKKYI